MENTLSDMVKVSVSAGIDGWSATAVGFHPQSGAYHRDAEGYISRYYDTPRDVTNHRYVRCWE